MTSLRLAGSEKFSGSKTTCPRYIRIMPPRSCSSKSFFTEAGVSRSSKVEKSSILGKGKQKVQQTRNFEEMFFSEEVRKSSMVRLGLANWFVSGSKENMGRMEAFVSLNPVYISVQRWQSISGPIMFYEGSSLEYSSENFSLFLLQTSHVDASFF